MASRRESIPAVVGVAGILTSSRARVRSASRVLAASRCSSWRGPPHAGQEPGAEVAGPAEHPAVGRGLEQGRVVGQLDLDPALAGAGDRLPAVGGGHGDRQHHDGDEEQRESGS
jgi:hypothetical protein